MNILRPLKPIQIVRNGVFLAGPTPRVGKEYNDPCDWREEAIKLFEEKGFDGDIIDPVTVILIKTIFELKLNGNQPDYDWRQQLFFGFQEVKNTRL